MMAKPRFKKEIDFGFGFKVPIVYRTMTDTGGGYTSVQPPGLCSSCANDHPKIILDPTEPLWDQMDYYGHEIIHAAIDFHRHMMLKHALEIRAEAARTEAEIKGDEDGDKGR